MSCELDAHPEIALVYGDILMTGYENQTFDSHIRTGYCLRPDWSPGIMLTGCHMGPQPMWRRAVHDDIGCFDENLKSAGDYEFWCRMAEKYKMRHIPDFLGLYLHNPKGVANSNLDLSDNETRSVKEAYKNRLPSPAGPFIPAYFHNKPVLPNRYVNIGMISFNRLDFTRQAIEALLFHTRFPHVLTVVDNGSRDGSREYLLEQKRRGTIRNLVILDENVGVARASNMAWLMESEADYYLKLDNDIVIQKKDWLADMVEAVDKIPRIGVAGYNFETVSYPASVVRGRRIRIKRAGNLGGACVLIPRRTREKIGFWCEEYGLYGEEDSDYAARVSCLNQWNAYMEDEHVGLHLPAGRASKIDPVTLAARDGAEERLYQEYRDHKDRLRKANYSSGRYQENLKRYKKGTRSLYVEPVFALHRLKGLFPCSPVKIRRRFLLRDYLSRLIHWKSFQEGPCWRHRFPESRLAHQYLDGLKGIEIGGAAHNSFGLQTINVDITWKMTPFKEEEIRRCGDCLPVDICARGDELPFRESAWDFVLSSHVLEHFPDPIKALLEWRRIVRPGGYLFMIVPHKDRTFDRERKRTTLQELIDRHKGLFGSLPENGHCSIWITEDVIELVRHLGWKIVECRDRDDKVGNGFTVLVQK